MSERIALISVTKNGALWGQRIKVVYKNKGLFPVCYEKAAYASGQEAILYDRLSSDYMGQLFKTYDKLLCIMATGITVRLLAPWIVHKAADPAVLVMDEQAQHVISLLSGHLGGANEWAQDIAQITGAEPVITTATDVNNKKAPDVLARHMGVVISSYETLRQINAAIVGGAQVSYYIDKELVHCKTYCQKAKKAGFTIKPISLTDFTEKLDLSSAIVTDDTEKKSASAELDYKQSVKKLKNWQVLITDASIASRLGLLVLVPKTITIGIGCRRGTTKEEILTAVDQSLTHLGKSPYSVLTAASVIVKANEAGLLAAMKERQWPIYFYKQEEMTALADQSFIHTSEFVKQTIGVGNVCEITALLAAHSQKLLQEKTIYPKTTVAIAQVQ